MVKHLGGKTCVVIHHLLEYIRDSLWRVTFSLTNVCNKSTGSIYGWLNTAKSMKI